MRGSDTSGTMQADAFQGHYHDMSPNYWAIGPTGDVDNVGSMLDLETGPNNTKEPISDGTNGTPRIASETRPINMSVVWVMRVK